jgi:hypothetical protein
MSYGLVGLYAIFLVFVGVNGNAKPLGAAVSEDAKGFAPWLLAVVILAALDDVDALKPVVVPFIGLAALTFALKNYGTVVGQINQITGLHLQGATA